ncbi:hypothetical protein BGZ61DRAFT_536452 [Ilyonectria robusta]|uniref:uncharacterized protein n=1 Tax=Ilyonectria robusta TaxID=1079257 RepID=UPI001E8DE9B3|nr:uncharacterized protein BGZ61DRAFT_536452 [Ilyonectria robusta]KAH8675172.1 hypothetical protein BGZ61DRAFT_536452 [Ilyonectria robusta]
MGDKFYAVAVGKETGDFDTWLEVQALVTGFKGNKHKSFATYEDTWVHVPQQFRVHNPGCIVNPQCAY